MKQYAKKEEVVTLLNKGWVIYTERTEITGSKGQLVYDAFFYEITNNKESKWVHHATIYSLIKSKTIYGPGNGFNNYKLLPK